MVTKNKKIKKFEDIYIKCLFRNMSLEEKPELYKIITEVDKKLNHILELQIIFNKLKNTHNSLVSKSIEKNKLYTPKKELEYFAYHSFNEFEREKEICDEKHNLITFIYNSLNCNKEQISINSPFCSRIHDLKEYLNREIIVQLGDLHSHLDDGITGNIVFPKFIFGNFDLFMPISFDSTKITFPEYVSGVINILPPYE